MSATHRLIGSPDDPREIELIRSLQDKTREGKITWRTEGSAITANILGGLKFSFVTTTNIFTYSSEWSLFTVRDKDNNQILQVSGGSILSILAGASSGVASATNDLFNLINASRRDNLDNAIDSVKNL